MQFRIVRVGFSPQTNNRLIFKWETNLNISSILSDGWRDCVTELGVTLEYRLSRRGPQGRRQPVHAVHGVPEGDHWTTSIYLLITDSHRSWYMVRWDGVGGKVERRLSLSFSLFYSLSFHPSHLSPWSVPLLLNKRVIRAGGSSRYRHHHTHHLIISSPVKGFDSILSLQHSNTPLHHMLHTILTWYALNELSYSVNSKGQSTIHNSEHQ